VMNDKVFSIVIWSLLYATIFAPFCFRKVLQRHAKREELELESQKGDDLDSKSQDMLGSLPNALEKVYAIQDVHKLAKVTVVADLVSENTDEKQPGTAGVSKIVQTIVQENFYIVRCGVDMHGHSAIFRFLLGQPKSPPVLSDAESTCAGSPPDSAKTQSTKQNAFSEGANADVVGLDFLKERIENCLDTRICTIIDSSAQGEDSHDAPTLSVPHGNTPTCEINFALDKIHKDFFSSVLNTLSKPGISLVCARVDEQSNSQVHCVISSSSLSKEMEEELLNELVQVCETLGPLNGHINLSNLNMPLEKQYRNVGLIADPKTVSTEVI